MGSICDVPGLKVGHDTDPVGVTGCTVVLCERGAVGGVDVRGGAPGTRETELLRPEKTVQRVHAVLLSGGSAFGLDAAGGVMRFLEERGVGLPIGGAVVPIVVGAILFDLMVGDGRARPDAAAGERACRAAASDAVTEGSVGAGTGATIGKLRGVASATKGGIGTASTRLSDGTVVGALMAVNAVGDVVDHATGRVLAGARRVDGAGFEDQAAYLDLDAHRVGRGWPQQGANTTIGVVATNAPLSKAQATRLAQVAHDGIALAIRPAHTPYDGDAIFALAVGGEDRPPPQMGSLGVAAVQAVAEAIARGVRAAHGLGGIPSVSELGGQS